jgi:hypothetical protein
MGTETTINVSLADEKNKDTWLFSLDVSPDLRRFALLYSQHKNLPMAGDNQVYY